MIKKFNELKQGDQFRFTWDPEGVIRTASQIGRTEIYCPRDGDNTMGHSKEGGEEVYLKSDKPVIMVKEIITESKVHFKNLPIEASVMFESAFNLAATRAFGAPLELPAEGLMIDFADIQDPSMKADLVRAVNVFTMAHAWLALHKRKKEQDEK